LYSSVVIMSPHFDDAVLSCWSVLTGSHQVEVVNVFTGPRGPETGLHEGELLTGVNDSVAHARERANEDRAALASVGARPHNLDLLEYPPSLAGRRLAPRRRNRHKHRLRELVEASAQHVDREAHVYVPAALGGHPDHELVREFGCRLVREGARVSFYADQPYCYVYGWPHWVVGEARDPYLDVDGDWRRYLDTASVSFKELRVDVVRLAGAHEQKLRALRLYRTQFPVLEGGANHRVSNSELTGWEVFWHA
jgi:LmbE family N-acetylglucosaminyl deacetylase